MESNRTVFYRIGDVVIRICSDFPFCLQDQNAVDFRIDATEADYTFRFERVASIPKAIGNHGPVYIFDYGCEMTGENGDYLRSFLWKDNFYDAVLRMGREENVISYVSPSILAERCAEGFNFANYYALERVFLKCDALVLHSSHVRVGDKALIFSAPSGTGKSTQADLWEKHAGAEVMNGDRTLLRKKDGVWHAYGCPMCGTSGIHKQGNEPIHAIVMLSQGTDNTVRRLTPGEAFQRMYPEITVPKWNRELVLRAMELLDDVMANVPIYAFSCTKDERAVTALREAIGL